MNQTAEITRMPRDWGDEIRAALEDLMLLVYSELPKQIARFLHRERQDLTLQMIALKHKTHIRLVDQREFDWISGIRFFGNAVNLMRRILVDYSRAKKTGTSVAVTLRFSSRMKTKESAEVSGNSRTTIGAS